MSEATINTTTSMCAVAELARGASEIIGDLADCDLAAIEQLFSLETAASKHVTRTAEGALFQLSVVNAHVDTILSHVPEHHEKLPRLEEMYAEVQRLLFSVSEFLESQGGKEVRRYYFSTDPFEQQH